MANQITTFNRPICIIKQNNYNQDSNIVPMRQTEFNLEYINSFDMYDVVYMRLKSI